MFQKKKGEFKMKKIIQMDLFASKNCRVCKGEGDFKEKENTFDCSCVLSKLWTAKMKGNQ